MRKFIILLLVFGSSAIAYGQVPGKSRAELDSIRIAKIEANKEARQAKLDSIQREKDFKTALKSIENIDTISVEIGRLNLLEYIAAGNYRKVDDKITEKNFVIRPSVKPGKVKVALVQFAKQTPVDLALKTVKQLYLYPASIEYLLAVGTCYEVGEEFPIAAPIEPNGIRMTRVYIPAIEIAVGEISGEKGKMLSLYPRDSFYLGFDLDQNFLFLALFEPVTE